MYIFLYCITYYCPLSIKSVQLKIRDCLKSSVMEARSYPGYVLPVFSVIYAFGD